MTYRRPFLTIIVFLSLLGAGVVAAGDTSYAAACAPPADYGNVSQTVTVPSTGTYRVWSRLKAPNSTNNSYLLQIDGTNCYKVGDNGSMAANAWTWVNYQNGSTSSVISVSLTAGAHSFVMYGNEPDVQLDRVILTADTSCVPTGTGDNCANPPDTTLPTVTISAPANGTTISSPTTVTAVASDDVAVSKVEFYIDNVLRATDTTAAYTYAFDPTAFGAGSHNIAAKVYDTSNNTATSGTVNVTVADATLPTVSITSPTSGATLTGIVTISANASDNVGVSKVEFYVDGALKGSDTTAPYAYSLNTATLSSGSHTITAKAFDTGNNSATSGPVTVTVADTTLPTVGISSPAAGATVSGNVTVSASATDNIGVTKVEFYLDGALKNTDTTAPYSYSLNSGTLTNGAHVLTAKAFDAANNSATSGTVNITVNNSVILAEDINQDGQVDLLDFSILSSKYGQTGVGIGRADINGNGVVDLIDFSRLASKYGSN